MSSSNVSLIYEFLSLRQVFVQQTHRVDMTVPVVIYDDVPSMSKQAQQVYEIFIFHICCLYSFPLSFLKFYIFCH
jgi:hypothetical protein